MNIEPIVGAALDTLLWAQTYVDDGDQGPITLSEAGLYDHPDDYKISPVIRRGLHEMLTDFTEAALEIAPDVFDKWTPGHIGIDFILTANGHGAGFWDRGLPYGDELTELCKPFGTISAWLDMETDTIMPGEGF